MGGRERESGERTCDDLAPLEQPEAVHFGLEALAAAPALAVSDELARRVPLGAEATRDVLPVPPVHVGEAQNLLHQRKANVLSRRRAQWEGKLQQNLLLVLPSRALERK